MKRTILSLIVSFLIFPFSAQVFGFGFDDEGSMFGGSGLPSVSISGQIQTQAVGFFDDFSNGVDHTQLGDMLSAKLNFSAESSLAKGVLNFNIKPQASPFAIDEAYLLAYFGKLDLLAGWRRIAWGKADFFGPLDVINPYDFSDLSSVIGDRESLKIARPLVHASLFLGQFSKLEGVFVFNFDPDHFAESGRWAPPQFVALSSMDIERPDTSTLDYAQAGLRFTTTINNGMTDIGFQYYYGRLTTPVITMLPGPVARFSYNPYHQIGMDYAQVLAGFNIRAEAAANITQDISGDDGSIYNPSLAWSLGFDRELFWGINLTAQCNQNIRLLDGKISDPNDIEFGTDLTSSLLFARTSKKFLRDQLEVTASVIWEIESNASLIMPSLIWTKDDLAIELSTGIFAGNDRGMFGQFRDNSFVMLAMTYTF